VGPCALNGSALSGWDRSLWDRSLSITSAMKNNASGRATVTVVDVARSAGVSKSTAARALSDSGYVSPETRKSVEAAAKRLGYIRNLAARSLRTRRTMILGLLIPDIEDPFFAALAKRIERVSKAAGYRVVLCDSNDDPGLEAEHAEALLEYQIDGLVATPTPGGAVLGKLQRAGIPLVQVDRRVDELHTDAVVLNNVLGGELAMRRLLKAGHTRIGLMTGPAEVVTAQERRRGYESALLLAGVEPDESLVRVGSFQRGVLEDEALHLLTGPSRPTAIFAASNLLCEATWFASGAAGLRIPEDLSVVGFDDMPWMSMVSPGVSTVRQPLDAMASAAVELLLDRLRTGEMTAAPRTVVFQPEYIERGTVSAP
jgi:LacI family transcriptional regulator